MERKGEVGRKGVRCVRQSNPKIRTSGARPAKNSATCPRHEGYEGRLPAKFQVKGALGSGDRREHRFHLCVENALNQS